MIYSFEGVNMMPGQLPAIEQIEQELTSVIWQPLYRCVVGVNRAIKGSSRDSGNTGYTDTLRPGLLLTKTADGSYFVPWGSVTDYATDRIEGVLLIATKMQRMGVDADRFMGHIMIGGYVKERGLIIPGETGAGIASHAQEMNIRRQMWKNFSFDDDPQGHKAALFAQGLGDLTGVDLDSPTNGDVLTFDGTNWVNSAP